MGQFEHFYKFPYNSPPRGNRTGQHRTSQPVSQPTWPSTGGVAEVGPLRTHCTSPRASAKCPHKESPLLLAGWQCTDEGAGGGGGRRGCRRKGN